MIERAYKRDMKHLERIRSDFHVRSSIVSNKSERQKSSQVESRNGIFDKAIEKAREPKIPNYDKIQMKKSKNLTS